MQTRTVGYAKHGRSTRYPRFTRYTRMRVSTLRSTYPSEFANST